jgi:hypothetical protein
MRNKKWLAATVMSVMGSVALAQTRYVANAPGTWKPWRFTAYPDHQRALGARPSDVKEVEAQLLRLNEILRKVDGLTKPVGFSVETVGLLELASGRLSAIPGEPKLPARPLPAQLNFGAYPVMEFGSGTAAKRVDTGETAQLLFFVNDLSQPLLSAPDHGVPEFERLEVDVVRLPPPQPDVFGFERYGADTLVLKKGAEPIWAAVTYSETLAIVARGIDQRLVGERDAANRVQAQYDEFTDPAKRAQRIAEYKKIAPLQKDPAYVDKMTKMEAVKEKSAATLLPQIASLKAVVARSEQEAAAARAVAAGLSAAEKVLPACYARDNELLARFRRAPAPGCDPLVRANWKLFNPALPRSAPQVLTISHFERCIVANQPSAHEGGCTANKRLLESIDKAALLAWLQ